MLLPEEEIVINEDEETPNEEEVNTESETETGEGEQPGQEVAPQEEKPPWQNRFKSAEDMYEQHKKLQSEKDKVLSELEKLRSPKEPQLDASDNVPFKEKFDLNPEQAIAEVVVKIVSQSFGDSLNYVNDNRIESYINEVKKVYPDFDFTNPENDKKLELELAKWDENHRRKNPIEVLTKAVENILGPDYKKKKMAENITKKKQNFTESGGMATTKVASSDDEINRITEQAQKANVPF